MTYTKPKSRILREEWFEKRIGKIVYRNRVSCTCEICRNGYTNGIYIIDSQHAGYLCDMEGMSNEDGIPLRYFATKKTRDNYEAKL